MQVNRVDSNSSFGARLKLKGDMKDWNHLVNFHNQDYAKPILDAFKNHEPDHTIELSLKKYRPLAQDWIVAKNLNTGVEGDSLKGAFFGTERIYPMNWDDGMHDNRSLYILLKRLISPVAYPDYNKFWRLPESQAKQVSDVRRIKLLAHDVFDIEG